MENKRLRPNMVDSLNIFLKEIGTTLSYRVKSQTGNLVNYRLVIDDMYVNNNNRTMAVDYNERFEKTVRKFFKTLFDIEDLGYSNTIETLVAYVNDDDIIGIARADGTVDYKTINNKRTFSFPARKHEFDEIEKMLDTQIIEPLKDDGEIIEEKIFHTTSKEKSVNNSEEKVL